MLDYQLEHLFSFTASNRAPEVIGPLAEGIRLNFYCAGGRVEGGRLHGRVLPVGGDWLTVRADGVAVLDVRATIEADDGALIYATYSGLIDLGPDGYERVLRGDLPPQAEIRTMPRFRTSHPAYLWLNRLQCVGIGRADNVRLEAQYDIYALR
jgi:hypothetical protein